MGDFVGGTHAIEAKGGLQVSDWACESALRRKDWQNFNDPTGALSTRNPSVTSTGSP
jgi:hypothetical protein